MLVSGSGYIFFFFLTLVTDPRRSLSLNLSDTRAETDRLVGGGVAQQVMRHRVMRHQVMRHQVMRLQVWGLGGGVFVGSGVSHRLVGREASLLPMRHQVMRHQVMRHGGVLVGSGVSHRLVRREAAQQHEQDHTCTDQQVLIFATVGPPRHRDNITNTAAIPAAFGVIRSFND